MFNLNQNEMELLNVELNSLIFGEIKIEDNDETPSYALGCDGCSGCSGKCCTSNTCRNG